MMKTYANYLFLTPVYLLMALLLSCEKGGEDGHDVILDDNLLKNESTYSEVLNARDAGENAPFAIQEVKRKGDSLLIHVLRGCSEDAYKIIWNGRIAESHPAQVHLVLTHEPAGDICQTSSEFLLHIDLRKIIGENSSPEDFIFHVANGSVKQDKSLYPDGTVSTEE